MEHVIKGKSGKSYTFDVHSIESVVSRRVTFPDGESVVVVLRQEVDGFTLVEYKDVKSNPAVVLNHWKDDRLCMRHHGATHLGVLRELQFLDPRSVYDDILTKHQPLCGLAHPYYTG